MERRLAVTPKKTDFKKAKIVRLSAQIFSGSRTSVMLLQSSSTAEQKHHDCTFARARDQRRSPRRSDGTSRALLRKQPDDFSDVGN
ncbi:hypothetical protein IVA88_10120 [Bradyrhizobium sp. 149]|uniref:hypothetical protein n=1 Tax=Bradyrhizobium sp. 149 TaxID=2782624 RepID=UPI001FFC2484|nr:hypothetical protein [Bradyrhizobium sp. 149]MCK1651790.1 hypothetical protein [Bradyrhizobium sp. 149]